MSLVYITYHNENIRDIEKETLEEKQFKFPKYVSIHHQAVKDAPPNQMEERGKKVVSASKKYLHKTMGYAETPLNNPSTFLKKNGGVKWQRLNDHVCPPVNGIPPIPKRSEMTKKGDAKKENFIKKNIRKTKAAQSPNIPPKYVDTPLGDRHNLDGTGLVPQHVFSNKFGKSPSYLKAIKKSLKERVFCNQLDQEDAMQGITVLSEAERKTILMGLRANHLELEKAYQLLPIFTDTHAKKQRKGKMELELKRLEQDILLMESNPVIYICDN